MEKFELQTPFCHQSMLTKKSLFNQYNNFDESYKIYADYKFILKLIKAKIPYVVLNEVIVYFRVSGISSDANMSVLSFMESAKALKDVIYTNSNIISYEDLLTMKSNRLTSSIKLLLKLILFGKSFSLKFYALKKIFRYIFQFRFIIAPIENYIRSKKVGNNR